MRCFALLPAIGLLLCVTLSAQEARLAEYHPDWTTGLLSITIEQLVPPGAANQPAAISQTQADIRRTAAPLIASVFAALPYDSYYTVGSLLEEKESAVSILMQAAREARAVDARATPDLQAALVTYEIDMYRDLVAPLLTHDHPLPLPISLKRVPHGEYTGIVVYAADPLDHWDTRAIAGPNRVRLEPAMRPGIYYRKGSADELFRLIEAENVEPEFLSQWGVVGYTSGLTDDLMSRRVGPNPLRIVASGVFGSRPTDLILSEEDTLQILSSPANRRLLSEGRILVIISPDKL
ncbi:MAG: hypothetical protein E4H09_01935 [Spirochaetales bacterium]|nr:MAG: hypothetical protein E4H09_01935 [Spirochaetales bacterium]